MADSQPIFYGRNINISNGFLSAPDYAKQLGINFFQIFITNPQQYNKARKNKEDLIKFKQKVQKHGQQFVIHGSFMLNFCNPCNDYKHKNACKLLINDLNDSVHCGAIGVIVHMGKNVKKLGLTEEQAIQNYVDGIKKVLAESDPKSTLIFETGAGNKIGSEICTPIVELAALYHRFTKKERKRIKFCIDTCHVYSAGYELSDKDAVNSFISLLDILLGWDNIIVIHLNNSEEPLNCHKDRHADLEHGWIETEGLKLFTQYCYKKRVPVCAETPLKLCKKEREVTLLKEWLEDVA